MTKLLNKLRLLIFTLLTTQRGPTADEAIEMADQLERINALYTYEQDRAQYNIEQSTTTYELLEEEREEHQRTLSMLKKEDDEHRETMKERDLAVKRCNELRAELTEEREEHQRSNSLWMHANDEVRDDLKAEEARRIEAERQLKTVTSEYHELKRKENKENTDRYYVVLFRNKYTDQLVRVGHFSEPTPTCQYSSFCINPRHPVNKESAEYMVYVMACALRINTY